MKFRAILFCSYRKMCYYCNVVKQTSAHDIMTNDEKETNVVENESPAQLQKSQ